MYKQIIDTYFNKNFNFIEKTAKNILNKINKTHMAPELVSEAYVYLIDNQDKLSQLVLQSGPESIIIRFMQYQVLWSKTKFKKNSIINNNNDSFDNSFENEDPVELSSNKKIQPQIYIIDDTEETLEKEKEFQDKYNQLQSNIQNLSKKNKIVWELYNKGFNNSGKLSKHIGLSRNTCYHIIRNMKEELGYQHITVKRKQK